MAFMVGLLGGIAISILSGICGQMTPSPPPGLNGHGDGASAAWHAARNAIHGEAKPVTTEKTSD